MNNQIYTLNRSLWLNGDERERQIETQRETEIDKQSVTQRQTEMERHT